MERDIKLTPHLTEKAIKNGDQNQYVFEVDKRANKIEIKKMVERKYNVKVKRMKIVNLPPKIKRLQRKESKVGGIKKAIITLQKGYKIEFGI
ncbi:MAG: 50S ribosomal protein L23 [Minisyncoccia bacterium]